MEKKTIVTISLVSAVISLIYVLLNYYGIIRYTGLYMFPIESYTKSYSKLDKIGKHRTVISLTATPDQLINISPTIKSLLDQTVKVDLISVIVPYGSKYKLPSKLKDSVSLVRCGEDNNTLNCLIPAVMRENESTTRIVTLGSNKIYGKDFIEELLEASEKNPDKIVYENNTDKINIEKGVVFMTSFFKDDFIDVPDGVGSNKWVNDYFKDFPKYKIEYNENYKSL